MTGRMPPAIALAAVLGLGLAFDSTTAARAQEPMTPVIQADNAAGFTPVAKAVLNRTIALRLEQVSLGEALDALADSAHVTVSYSRAEASLNKIVSLSAYHITVRDALRALLVGTGLEVDVSRAGRVRIGPASGPLLTRRNSAVEQQGGGVITGRVVDEVTRAPLEQVAVGVEGPGLSAATAGDGYYSIRNVPPGTYRVTSRCVGYVPLTKTVTVAADSTAAADFGLAAAATKLNEVVTTAVGDQRRYEVGNVISTINAVSIAPTAPITSLTDLISARAPGVEVLESSGLTGSGETIRIRGQSSLQLQSDPIIIVDGVRQDNSPGGNSGTNSLAGTYSPSPSRLNDLNYSDIETIDVLKGPAASTEYGTDAANGVIVVTTKRGQAGRPQWTASAEQAQNAIPEPFPNLYYSWGHTLDAAHTPVNCPLVPGLASSYGVTVGNCAVDSVTQWNPLNHPYYSMFGTGQRRRYELSVSGGSDVLRYFVSGGISGETGIARMPAAFLSQATALGFPASALAPNGEDQRSIRANTAIRLGSTADLTVNGAYLTTYQKTVSSASLIDGVFTYPAFRDSAHVYGYGVAAFSPLSAFGQLASENTNRLIGGMTGNWRPTAWLVGHGTVGVDHGSRATTTLSLPQANFFSSGSENQGASGLGLGTTDIYSGDVRASATAALTQAVRAITSVGLQLADTRSTAVTGSAGGLSSTNLTVNGSPAPYVVQQGGRQATLGGYVEEQIGIAERLFLTGAVRVDAGSGFGRDYRTAAYPKASASWLALAQGSTTVRLRGAFGASGVQPPNGAALLLYTPTVAWLNGGPVSVGLITGAGNPILQPERSAEYEGGFDASFWHDRVTLDFTDYSKTTNDALVSTFAGWDVGYAFEQNIGQVRNTGTEATITATLLRTTPLTWDVSLNGSINHNKLVHLAPSINGQIFGGEYAEYRQAPGYPLYGFYGQRMSYADANHDGIIESTEVTVADSSSYLGSSIPTREMAIATHVAVLKSAVTIGALFDYRGGFRVANTAAYAEAQVQNAQAQNDPHAPLWQQARSVAVLSAFSIPSGFYEDGTYVRFRELAVTYNAPQRLAHAVRMRHLSITGAVRNLVLWTRYSGADPEVTNSGGFNTQYQNNASNAPFLNNDIREDYGAVPLPRSWVVRVNGGF